MKTTDHPIIIEQQMASSVETIWAALTEISHMRRWFFDNIPDFKAEVGFETSFDVSNEHRTFPHIWKVQHVTPYKRLVVNWTYSGYVGSSNIHFQILSSGSINYVLLSTEVIEDYQDDIPEFKRESALEGWNYFIKDRLKGYLDE